jgi:hypothetical protein
MNQKKYNRKNIYLEMTGMKNVELDISNSHFNSFKTTSTPRLYQINKFEAGRPDLISQGIYQNSNYWWILMQYNDIVDVFSELKAGLILQVPSRKDIQNFMKDVAKLIKKEQLSQASKTFK